MGVGGAASWPLQAGWRDGWMLEGWRQRVGATRSATAGPRGGRPEKTVIIDRQAL
ncbi:hypothetical protein SGP1_0025 (plasmid) [Sodalis glossinidius str. 'morsitans']|uniref:Uncharacterized protein n=1 Tax=Sodalis glossinidius (strain morsitans) TaxID=343509 RepID=Q2NQ43_SODGM|nr:hypothetical protein SGP1_0025 [Sodalis glossinidius str. 'morsitans']